MSEEPKKATFTGEGAKELEAVMVQGVAAGDVTVEGGMVSESFEVPTPKPKPVLKPMAGSMPPPPPTKPRIPKAAELKEAIREFDKDTVFKIASFAKKSERFQILSVVGGRLCLVGSGPTWWQAFMMYDEWYRKHHEDDDDEEDAVEPDPQPEVAQP